MRQQKQSMDEIMSGEASTGTDGCLSDGAGDEGRDDR